MYIYRYIYIYKYIFLYLCIYICKYIHVYIYIYVYVYILLRIHAKYCVLIPSKRITNSSCNITEHDPLTLEEHQLLENIGKCADDEDRMGFPFFAFALPKITRRICLSKEILKIHLMDFPP